MTLNSFMNSAFPLTGQLDKVACGHLFLNGYADGRLTLDQGAGAGLDGKSLVRIDARAPVAMRIAREGQDIRQGGGSAERQAFRAALQAHLSPRLGSLYAEFERRIDAQRVFTNSNTHLSISEISAFSTAAREVIHYADARSEIEALRKRCVDAFEAVRERPAAAADDLCTRCVQCVSRDVSADIRDIGGPLVANAPEVYKIFLARELTAAVANVGRARERATGQVVISIPDAGPRAERDEQRTPFMRSSSNHVEAGDSDDDYVAAAPAASASSRSLFQRFFGDCFSDRVERRHAE